MRGKRRIIPILLILSLFCCSCGMEENAAGMVESEQTAEEPEEMPTIVFFLYVKFSMWGHDKDADKPQSSISFIDNQGNMYSASDAYFNGLTCGEIYDEFAAGKINEYLTLDTSCDLNELRKNYELLKSVAENEDLQLIPENELPIPSIEEDDYWWLACYYDENGEPSWITFRLQLDHPHGTPDRVDDERADQVYEWLVSLSGRWK
ncbi:MAG: hypothetical protein NC092_09380 [Butyrivibrio sp.]|nr:hypothetical protein [Muribaculum sp.]MCM1552887.1 hypothetical protein [Butyrivibrio sp.]